jgi:hypothetical protein
MKNRLQAVHLLDRAFTAMTDDDIAAAYAALPEDHQQALDDLADAPEAGFTSAADRVAGLRATAVRGRLNGGLEQIATVITDPCLAACIEQLGKHSDNPTEAQLLEVTPGLIETFGLPVVRLMLASSVAGEAAATPMLMRVLKNDETLALPKLDRPAIPLMPTRVADDDVRSRRKAAKATKQAESAARRLQQAKARNRI